jgi:hypothetical protein
VHTRGVDVPLARGRGALDAQDDTASFDVASSASLDVCPSREHVLGDLATQLERSDSAAVRKRAAELLEKPFAKEAAPQSGERPCGG